MATEAEHLAAVKAFLEAAGARPHTVQELDGLTSPPTYYTEVHVSQRLSTGPRTDDPSTRTEWRILTRAVGQRYANAQLMRARAHALHGATLTVGGETFPVERSIDDDPIGPDDGWWSGTSEYVC